MKVKALVAILVFLILINLATLGTYLYVRFAVPQEPPPPLTIEGQPPVMLSLDPEIRGQLRNLMIDFRATTRPLQEQIIQYEDSIATLLAREPVPEERIDSLFRRISELRVSINHMAVQRLIKTKSFLTTEQQRLFFRAILEARPLMRPGQGFGRGPRMGPDSGRGRPFGRGGPLHRLN